MREGLPTFILTIQEYREFKILNSLVQGSDTSPADAVEKIAKITVEMRDTQLRGDHLWYTCVSVIELAQRTPPEHQTRLVEFIVLLSQTSVMDPETGKHMMHHGDLVWTGLPSLGYTAADEWYAFGMWLAIPTEVRLPTKLT